MIKSAVTALFPGKSEVFYISLSRLRPTFIALRSSQCLCMLNALAAAKILVFILHFGYVTDLVPNLF